jgi:hypothetical protein
MPFVPRRPGLPWLLAFALTVVGWISAHEVAYRLAIPHPHARASELAETGHAYLAYGSLAAVMLLLVALLCTAGLAARPHSQRPPARRLLLLFVLLPPIGFVLQEHLERLLTTGRIPYDAVLEPPFLAGVLLQLPFALAALAVAHGLFALARRIARRVRSGGRPTLVSVELGWPPAVDARSPRRPALAFGYGERGPPLNATS